ncbi:hypothetical protein PTI98_008390 [Pleurotus ostreatus]|nr:hypothetical protein PTI98_008390 [Pleurotus ostreatus]
MSRPLFNVQRSTITTTPSYSRTLVNRHFTPKKVKHPGPFFGHFWDLVPRRDPFSDIFSGGADVGLLVIHFVVLYAKGGGKNGRHVSQSEAFNVAAMSWIGLKGGDLAASRIQHRISLLVTLQPFPRSPSCPGSRMPR